MKRLFDLIASIFTLVILFLPICLLALLIKVTSRGPVFHWSSRIGKNNIIFQMPKFRTMKVGTPIVASHLLKNCNHHLTPLGSFLRKSSLDELPQLWNIIKGEMSFVGPRPALFNQDDLIYFRTQFGVDVLVPGLTGWAQINGRDELNIPIKVLYDYEYLYMQSFWFDLKIIFLTFLKVIQRSGISH